uniref:Cytochrome b6-f complex subunit 6 n=1 Tax=Orthotrichum obtusifolium TaxID=61564 RepID=A0A0F6Q171_9BRYO|nr:PetL [Orthotrichum obtusifolium]AKC99498.1 PetL [Orthotrichum obtusifolium]
MLTVISYFLFLFASLFLALGLFIGLTKIQLI